MCSHVLTCACAVWLLRCGGRSVMACDECGMSACGLLCLRIVSCVSMGTVPVEVLLVS